ncbi:hypothetical protein K2X89_13560 [Myxococcota bacterium]|nr:hypothetical protein [Myxococcota bacterium]
MSSELGLTGESWSEHEIDCLNQTIRYLREGDSHDDLLKRLPFNPPNKMVHPFEDTIMAGHVATNCH